MVFKNSPSCPKEMIWANHFPKFFPAWSNAEANTHQSRKVEVADIGCGFGGLIVSLAPKLPDTLMLGMLRPWLIYCLKAVVYLQQP